MPSIGVVFYTEDTRAPVKAWMEELKRADRKGFAKCLVRVRELAQFGHDLRRPAADYLRDGIYELRAKHGHIQYRLLYCFYGRTIAVLVHALVKEGSAVPEADLERALRRKRAFEQDPNGHTLEMSDLEE